MKPHGYHRGVALRVDGVQLTPAQIKLAMPFLKKLRNGQTKQGAFINSVIYACGKAGLPLHPKEFTEETA